MTTNDMTLDARRGSSRQFVGLAGLGLATIALGNLTGCSKGATQYVYDVVVVGSGGSGTTSAAFAAKNGAKTVCIEKLGWQGGSRPPCARNVLRLGYGRKELGIDDTPDDYYNYLLTRNADKVDLAMNCFMADHRRASIDWPREDLKVPFKDEIKGNGKDTARALACKNNADDALKAVTQLAKEQGVDFHFDTDATALIDESTGRVVGVRAEKAGKEVIYNAKAAVIASGGFCRNPEMIAKYCPD